MSTPSPSTLKVGIAGLGRLGRLHAEQLRRYTPGCELVAACSPVADERDWARHTLGVATLHEHFEDLIADPQLDAVVIVTPTALHASQTIAALEAGKHVFVEKPLALEVADCERVEAVARRHPHQVAMVGFVRRFDPSYHNAYQHIGQGGIGRPFLVRSQTCDQLDPSGFFVRFAPTSGGIFLDCSVHDIDLARWLLGACRTFGCEGEKALKRGQLREDLRHVAGLHNESRNANGPLSAPLQPAYRKSDRLLGSPKATRVFATGTVAVHHELEALGDVDNGLAVVEFEGGARAVFYASRTFAHGHETSTEIIGTAGKLLVGAGAGAARDRVVISDAHGVRQLAVADFHERFREAFQREMAAFVGACRGEAHPGATLADATEATRIGVAIRRALQSGGVEGVE